MKKIILIVSGITIVVLVFIIFVYNNRNKQFLSGTEEQKINTEQINSNANIIEGGVNEEIVLTTIIFKINSVEEKQILSTRYGTPRVAEENTKFIVIDMSITNTTNSEFTFFPDDGLRLIDNRERQFTTYADIIMSVDNYLNVRKLSPSIKETGVLVYKIPKDAESYSLIVGKAGTNEIYKVILK